MSISYFSLIVSMWILTISALSLDAEIYIESQRQKVYISQCDTMGNDYICRVAFSINLSKLC